MPKISIKQIKQELKKASYQHLTENRPFYFFKRSDYFKYIIEENSIDNVSYYATKFINDTRFINLF